MIYFFNTKVIVTLEKQTSKKPQMTKFYFWASQRTKVITHVSKLIYEEELLDLLILAFPHSGNTCLQLDIFPLSKLLLW